MRDTFIARLQSLAEADPKLVLVTGDLGFGVFDDFRRKRARQFINAGVSEQNATMVATGMALEGWTAFTYSIGNFPTIRCLEMIRNDAAYHAANVKVVAVGGGFSYGALGPSHHATEDIAIMRAIPDVTVVVPSGLWEVDRATAAITRFPGTCYLRLDKSVGDDRPAAGEVFEIGRARTLKTGGDVTFITAGGILGEVWAAVELLSNVGIEAGVVSMHTVKPIDVQAINQLVTRTGAIMVVEEHSIDGGLGGAVAEVIAESTHGAIKFGRIGLGPGFCSDVGSQLYLRQRYGLSSEHICERTSQLLRDGVDQTDSTRSPAMGAEGDTTRP